MATAPKASVAGYAAAAALIKEIGWAANAGRKTTNAIGIMFDNFAKQRDGRVTELLEANNALVDEKRARERVCEAARRHLASFQPGTLCGSELNLALRLRELDGDIWADWCVPGDLADEDIELAELDIVELVNDEGKWPSGTRCTVVRITEPREPHYIVELTDPPDTLLAERSDLKFVERPIPAKVAA